MYRFALTTLTCLSIAFAAASAEAALTAEQILDKQIEASGGQEKLNSIHTMRLEGAMEMAAMGFKGEIRTAVGEGQRFVTEIDLGQIKIRRGAKDGIVWETNSMMGPRILEGAEREMLLQESNPLGESDWRDQYETYELVGEETFEDEPCYVLNLTQKVIEGPITAYINRETFLMKGLKLTVTTEMGEIPMEMVFTEYMTVDGIPVPKTITQRVIGQEILITFSSYEFNVDVPDETFDLPEEVQALVDAQGAETAAP